MKVSRELVDIKVAQKRALFNETFDETAKKESVIAITEILYKAWKARSNKRRQHWVTPDCEVLGEDVVEYILARYHPEADKPSLSKNAEAYLASSEKNKPTPPGVDPIDAAEEIKEYENILMTEAAIADHCIMAIRTYKQSHGMTPMPNPDFFLELAPELLFVTLRRHRPDLVNPRKL